jgi:hypothetical protein
VTWTLSDFAIAGAPLFGAGLTFELVASRGTTAARAAVGGIRSLVSKRRRRGPTDRNRIGEVDCCAMLMSVDVNLALAGS